MSFFGKLQGRIMLNSESILRELFGISVSAVQPHKLIEKFVQVNGRHLLVNERAYELKKPVRIVGFGKAILGMALALDRKLGDQLEMGVVSIPEGSLIADNTGNNQIENSKNSKIEFLEGARNNLPDENSMKAALKIQDSIKNLDKDDTVIVLISGGGSALLPLPKNKITLPEKLDLIKKLANKGADIRELNCVRKELSELKGGRLAAQCYPARVISIILSDVLGDPLDIIASGPTCPNNDGPEKAVNILKKFQLYHDLPISIKDTIGNNLKQTKQKIMSGKIFEKVDNFIIGNNVIAAQAILEKTKEINLQSFILSTNIGGNVEEVSQCYLKIAESFIDFQKNNEENDRLIQKLLSLKSFFNIQDESKLIEDIKKLDPKRDICVILAGEPTVNVTGKGKGGRNQQLALSFSLKLSKLEKQNGSGYIWFLSCGTDGIDGPTDAAGAIGFSELVSQCTRENLKPEKYLENNDCYSFYDLFCGGKYLVKTGHTGTNVMDIHLMLIKAC